MTFDYDAYTDALLDKHLADRCTNCGSVIPNNKRGVTQCKVCEDWTCDDCLDEGKCFECKKDAEDGVEEVGDD